MSSTRPAHIFTIPPHMDFLDLLAARVLAGGFPCSTTAPPTPETLSGWRIYVPTRRAAGMLKEAFLRQSGQKALILPRITPLGDPEEDELALVGGVGEEAEGLAAGLAPAITPLARRLVLTRLIRAMDDAVYKANLELGRDHDFGHSAGQAVRLAGDLGRLMDTAEIDQVSWDALATLVPESFARNWQLTLEFLKIATQMWPEYLREHGLVSPIARRNALLLARAAHFASHPPASPVIAAGSTGSTPVTARLLGVIAALPQGAVVLPGLDTALGGDAWQELGPDHPQYGMAQLLNAMQVLPRKVKVLGHESSKAEQKIALQNLTSEMMRPARQTHLWKSIKKRIRREDIKTALADLALIEAPDAGAEARVIALIMRETLEHENRTAALITPDRALARRVAGELARWDIQVEDSSGRPLRTTLPGRFLLLIGEAVMAKFPPLALLALLKHPYCTLGLAGQKYARALRCLDLALRGPPPAAGLAGIQKALKQRRKDVQKHHHAHPAIKRLEEDDWQAAQDLLGALAQAASSFASLFETGNPAALKTLLRSHIEMAQRLSSPGKAEDNSPLWQGEAGEAAMNFVAALDEAAGDHDYLEAGEYGDFLESLMDEVTVRPRQSHHPRLFIWGTLEARLQHADVTILGGLNEGIWPAATRTDPWLSRPMRGHLGLEPLERRIGLSAHDFAQALCSGKVYLTRAQKQDGTPSVPSRWLLRLRALVRGLDLEAQLAPAPETPWLAWSEALGAPPEHAPIAPPAPCPPVEYRPRRMSVTAIERWIRDPYEIYARWVLGLAPLDDLETPPDARIKGILIHDILQEFIEGEAAGPLRKGALERLLAIADKAFEEVSVWPDRQAFWKRRFVDIARWFVMQEETRRADIAVTHVEKAASLEVPGITPPFILTARADRIDIHKDGTASIIDYKTGAPPTGKMLEAGLAPQLPLEAALLAAGGFAGLPEAQARDLIYMKLSGGAPAGELRHVSRKTSAMELAQRAMTELAGAIALYDLPQTPYVVRRMAQFENRLGDYDHLARTREWRLLMTEAQET